MTTLSRLNANPNHNPNPNHIPKTPTLSLSLSLTLTISLTCSRPLQPLITVKPECKQHISAAVTVGTEA